VDNEEGKDGKDDCHPDHNRSELGHPVTRGTHTPRLGRLRAPRTVYEGAKLGGAGGSVSLFMIAHAHDCS
jgi:hypothetical protein